MGANKRKLKQYVQPNPTQPGYLEKEKLSYSHQTYWKGGEKVGEDLAGELPILPVDQLGGKLLSSTKS